MRATTTSPEHAPALADADDAQDGEQNDRAH